MKTANILNRAAAISTIFMGISHLFVPFLLPWQEHLEMLYEPITWALYAMNFFFSILLAWGGFLSWSALSSKRYSVRINGGMAVFWVIGGIYEIVIPFPIAEAKWALPAISFTIASLYIAALIRYSHAEAKNTTVKENC